MVVGKCLNSVLLFCDEPQEPMLSTLHWSTAVTCQALEMASSPVSTCPTNRICSAIGLSSKNIGLKFNAVRNSLNFV